MEEKENKFKVIMKKCFGKEKDDRWHAVAMLALYGIFFLVSFTILSIGSGTSNNTSPTPTATPDNITNINYSYSYTINYDDTSLIYLGKKYNDKEKFTLIENGISSEYVVLNGKILKLNSGKYEETNSVNNYYRYCDREKILNIIKDIEPVSENVYNVSIAYFSSTFGDTIEEDNGMPIVVTVSKDNDEIKNISMDLDNYLKSLGDEHSLKINMIFTDIGTTNDFEINIEE